MTRQSLLLTLTLLALAPTVGVAQARVHGVIRDSTQGTPLPLVEVLVAGMNLSTLTDGEGRYALSIPLGFHTLMFRRVGYHPVTRQLRLSTADSVRLDLAMLSQAQRLDSIRVVAPAPPPIWPPGISDRMKDGFGTFIGDSTLRRFDHTSLGVVLESRAGAVRVVQVQGRQMAIQRRGDPMGKNCAMSVYLDGVLLYAGGPYSPPRGRRPSAFNSMEPPDLSRIANVNLTSVEVYNSATVPSQFRAGGGRCGAIVMWTRQSLGNGESR